MKKFDYKEFEKRYDKFKKNNLPTPFWDNERQTFEYVYFHNEKLFLNSVEQKNELEINKNLTDALGDIANIGFYYPFTSKYIQEHREDGRIIKKILVGHNHAHSFEDVVESLYYSPESFSISKEEEEFYSKQELNYIRRVQKYLLFIGMKDLEINKIPVSRYRNKIHSKYENASIHKFTDTLITDVLNGKRNFSIIDWYPEYIGDKKYNSHKFQALIVDKEDNFKMFIEYTKREVKYYRDIKEIYINDKLKDDDKVILNYFKVLEIL